VAQLLQAAGVDFAILGAAESCTGDPARRMGNEYVFQAFAEANIEVLNEAKVTKIVANCPHCFNTLANEYPDFGGRYEVVHHTELLSSLMREGRLSVPGGGADGGAGENGGAAGGGLSITYHDSCYLARHNDVLAAPRDLIAALGEPVEMARSGKQTFCCGAGGAHMWMEERARPINEERVREAAATGADTLAVACPFCTVMLDDGVQSTGDGLRVVDVATLLAEAMAAGGGGDGGVLETGASHGRAAGGAAGGAAEEAARGAAGGAAGEAAGAAAGVAADGAASRGPSGDNGGAAA
jgi:Fe-S oxidoreductase